MLGVVYARCGTARCSLCVVWYSPVWYSMVWSMCRRVQPGMVQYGVVYVLYGTVRYGIVWSSLCVVWYSPVWYSMEWSMYRMVHGVVQRDPPHPTSRSLDPVAIRPITPILLLLLLALLALSIKLPRLAPILRGGLGEVVVFWLSYYFFGMKYQPAGKEFVLSFLTRTLPCGSRTKVELIL